MATQPEAVADAPVVETDGAAIETQPSHEDLYDDQPPQGAEPEPGVETEGAEEQQQEAEPDPAIDPPVSWNKEAKEKFAQLPPDMQSFLAEQDAHRNRQVQDITTRAAEAQREAETSIAAGIAESQQHYAQQLEQIATFYLPPEPNPAQFSDMQSFQNAKLQHDQAMQRHYQVMQHLDQVRQQSEQQIQQQQQEEVIRDARRVAVELPEVHDGAAYQQLVKDLTPIARELGYDDRRIAMALPSDILAMKRVSNWKAKAERWDAIQSKKMESVRAAKSLPKVTQPGTAASAQKPADPLAVLYPND